MRSRIWLKHKYREDDFCPLCGGKLKWVYDGDVWIPCDSAPVLFRFEKGGRVQIVKNRQIYSGCELFKGGGNGYIRGLLPHVYSCQDLCGWGGVKIERID